MTATIGLSLALLVVGAGGPAPCDLLDRAAASQLLGQPPTSVTPSGPEPDEETKGVRSICVYQVGTRLIVTRVVFSSAKAALDATTEELVGERYDDDKFTITPEPGLGDRGFWAYSPTAAEYIVVKGASALGLALGGMPKQPVSYQATLRAAAAAAKL